VPWENADETEVKQKAKQTAMPRIIDASSHRHYGTNQEQIQASGQQSNRPRKKLKRPLLRYSGRQDDLGSRLSPLISKPIFLMHVV